MRHSIQSIRTNFKDKSFSNGLNEDSYCWITVVFHLTLFQLIRMTSSSQIQFDKRVKSERFQRQQALSKKWWKIVSTPLLCRKMMRMRPSTILLKEPIAHQKFHFHILMQQEALFWSKHSDRLFLDREWSKSLCPWKRRTTNTITFCGNFCLCLMPPFLSSSSRSRVHTRSFWELSRPSMSKNFSSEKRIFVVSFFSKICSNPIFKCFSVWSLNRWKAMLRLLS